MAKKKAKKVKSYGGLPASHDVYGYIAVGIIFVVLFALLSGLNKTL